MPTDYTKDGATRFAALVGPQDGYAIVAGPDNTLKIVAGPLSASPVEAISCNTNGVVTLSSGSSMSGASLTNATLTTPTLSGSVTGTYTLAGTPTITSPAISNPTLSGTATGTYTLGGTPTITSPAISNPVLSGSATGTYTLAGTPTITSPTITTPNISSPVLSGTATGTYTLGGNPIILNQSAASTMLAGGGSATITDIGTLYTNATVAPSSTAVQIADRYILPASSLSAGKYLYICVWAVHAANTNSCTIALNWGGTGVIGANVVGGTTLGTQLSAVNAGVFFIEAYILRSGLNTQSFFGSSQSAATASALQGGTLAYAEGAPIQINLVMLNASAASDATASWFIQWSN